MENQKSSVMLSMWIASEECNPEERPTPQEAINAAIRRAEKVAYARGLRDGLDRLERIALIIPSRGITAQYLIERAQRELAEAIAKWKKGQQ